jgi:uncharacterized protein (TIGR00251 family)
MIELTRQGEWLLIPIKARPGGRRNGIDGTHAGMLKVEVTAPPEKGKANDAICKLLADELGIGRSNVQVVRGETSATKLVGVAGLREEDLRLKLATWSNQPMKRGSS